VAPYFDVQPDAALEPFETEAARHPGSSFVTVPAYILINTSLSLSTNTLVLKGNWRKLKEKLAIHLTEFSCLYLVGCWINAARNFRHIML
jgi:hypothetical protein